jgi:hypothetical protein
MHGILIANGSRFPSGVNWESKRVTEVKALILKVLSPLKAEKNP